jgi:tripartite-type tricarboxylate transporter receptor subunit TctC
MKTFVRVAAALLMLGSSLVHAQTWPSKPVRWLVPFPPGGASDIVTRVVSEKLTVKWGQPIVAENKPGAGGTIATTELVRSGKDGYTVMIGTLGTHAIAPNLYKGLSYEASRDLLPVAMLIQSPMVLIASPQLPANTLGEFVTLARANPDKYSIASPGNGTLNHLMAELFKQAAKLDMQHVPYKGSAPAYPDLMSGRVALMFDPMASVVSPVKQGSLKAFAISHRSAALPGVPTMAEAGYPNFDVALWVGLFTTSGTPPAVVSKMSADVVEALKTPEAKEKLEAVGSQIAAMPHDQFAKVYAGELERWGKVIRDLNIRID